MDAKLQLKLAADDGPDAVKDYKYHLGMVETPLTYQQFKVHKTNLDCHFAADPDGLQGWRDAEINRLCRILGY